MKLQICRIVSSGDLMYNRVIIVDNNIFIVCLKFTSSVYLNCSHQKEKTKTRVTVYKVLNMLFNLILVNISYNICMSKHHIVYLKYELFVSYTSIKLEKVNK